VIPIVFIDDEKRRGIHGRPRLTLSWENQLQSVNSPIDDWQNFISQMAADNILSAICEVSPDRILTFPWTRPFSIERFAFALLIPPKMLITHHKHCATRIVASDQLLSRTVRTKWSPDHRQTFLHPPKLQSTPQIQSITLNYLSGEFCYSPTLSPDICNSVACILSAGSSHFTLSWPSPLCSAAAPCASTSWTT
jgi:hypothetical protein